MFDALNVPIIGLDANGAVTEWNSQTVSLTGYSKDEVMGHLVNGLVSQVHAAACTSFRAEVCRMKRRMRRGARDG